MLRKICSLITITILGAAIILPSSDVGAVNTTCSNPKEGGVIWYHGGSATRAGELNPGQTYDGIIEACNDDIVTRQVKLETAPYSISQNDYDNVDFMTKNTWNALADWISFPESDSYTIGSGETVYMKFRIQVPSDGTAIAGTQSASIMLTDVFREDDEENVGLQTEKRYLWLVTADIDGANARRGGKIVDWWSDGFLVFDNSNGIRTKSLVENTGNINFMADYKLTITDLFRNNAVAYEETSQKEILPESIRANEFKWNEAPAIGVFNIKEDITVYDSTETFEKMVLIVPLWFVIIIAAIIILLIWVLILKIKQARKKIKD